MIRGRVIYAPRSRGVMASPGNTGDMAQLRLTDQPVSISFSRRLKRIPLFRDVEIPIATIRGIERLVLRGLMFRTSAQETDGTCFIPYGTSTAQLTELLQSRGVPIVPTSTMRRIELGLAHLLDLVPFGVFLSRRLLNSGSGGAHSGT